MFVTGWVISQEAFGHIQSDYSYPNGTDVRASNRLEEVQSLRHRNGFGAPAHAQLTVNAADLGLNRVRGNDQSFCHLSIGAPSHQQPQHLLLLSTQWLDESSLYGVPRWMWQGLICSGRRDIASPRECVFFLVKSCQQEQHIRFGNSLG